MQHEKLWAAEGDRGEVPSPIPLQHHVPDPPVSAESRLHPLNPAGSCCSGKCFLGPRRHLCQNAKIPAEQLLILPGNWEGAKPPKHNPDHKGHAKLGVSLVFFLFHGDPRAKYNFLSFGCDGPWCVLQVFVCTNGGGTNLLEVKIVELFLNIYIFFVLPLQSVLLPLSTLHFPVAWCHSQDVNSRTGLLLFLVSFNPSTGSHRFFRTSTFLTRKLWGGETGEGKHYIWSPTHLWHWKWEFTCGRFMTLQEKRWALLTAMLKLSLLGSWVNPLRRMGQLPLLSYQHSLHFRWLCSRSRESKKIFPLEFLLTLNVWV